MRIQMGKLVSPISAWGDLLGLCFFSLRLGLPLLISRAIFPVPSFLPWLSSFLFHLLMLFVRPHQLRLFLPSAYYLGLAMGWRPHTSFIFLYLASRPFMLYCADPRLPTGTHLASFLSPSYRPPSHPPHSRLTVEIRPRAQPL